MIESPLSSSTVPARPFVAESELCIHPSVLPDIADTSPSAELEPSAIPMVTPTEYFRVKRVVDFVFVMLLMSVAIPIILLVAMLVLLCDGRPVFYRQVRVGKRGRLFRILKFRTMRRHAERDTGAVWSSPTDPRVSKLGRWLRCSHLDELPQLFNVLAGDMSLVGPRPERPEFVETLAAEVPNYMQRTQVAPGITGIAQLTLGYDESIVGIPDKVACDLQYIRTASFRKDVQLLLSTLPYVIGQIYFKLGAKRQYDVQESSEQPQDGVVTLTRNIA